LPQLTHRTFMYKPFESLLLLLTLVPVAAAAPAWAQGQADAEDESNCLLCHQNRGLSRIDDEGNFKLFYIHEQLYQAGPHRRIECKGCHSDIDEIPHDEAEKVDCTRECHITEPSGKGRFSHRPIADILAKSAHGGLDAEGRPKPYQEDYPGCKDCHDQPLYRPISFYKGKKHAGISPRSVGRCKSCHRTGNFAEDFFEHVSSRLQKMRFPIETVEVCAKCHQDPDLNRRHELDDAVTTYKQTFHGKLLALGSERTADCIDCHVVEGENVHLIEAKTVAGSAVSPSNVANTCRTSECHSSAGPELAGFQVHVTYDREKYPLEFYMLIAFKALLAVIMYFFLTLIFLELMRRLFPNFSFFKHKRRHVPTDASPAADPER
jgi:hypothetical protein